METEVGDSTDINDLSDYALQLVFTNVSPYEDLDSVKLVSRRWNRVCSTTVERMKKLFEKCTSFAWSQVEETAHGHPLSAESLPPSERCSHAACYHSSANAMYIFGGCTSTYTAFNDLWLFDLITREWERVLITKAPLPSAKALASMVLYKESLILYGGFSKSSMNPIHQTSQFYNEIHMYSRESNPDAWEEIVCENTAPHLAGHTASIVGDFMLVFGGSMGSSYNNNVYVLDILQRIWLMPSIPGPCPPARYGQSQILLDDRHLVIIGGCGGPSLMFHDCWLLDFDLYGDAEWRWTQLKVENLELYPPYLWCHHACQVGHNAVVLSRPIRQDMLRRRSRRRRGSSQSSSSVGGQRIPSPDSPDRYHDRRAVAAAFSSSSLSQEGCIRMKGDGRRLLYSRSLDEQEHQQPSSSSSPSSRRPPRNPLMTNASNPQCSKLSSNGCSSKLGSEQQLLHRACSIPAIIVGEIPTLIVTSTHEQPQQHAKSSPSQAGRQSLPEATKRVEHENAKEKGKGNAVGKATSTSTPTSSSSSSSSSSISSSKAAGKRGQQMDDRDVDTTGVASVQPGSAEKDEVHQYYLSLLREEYHRLKLVKLAEEMEKSGTSLLEAFLANNLPHLTTLERCELISELLSAPSLCEHSHSHKGAQTLCSGRLSDKRNTRTRSTASSIGMETESGSGGNADVSLPSTSSAQSEEISGARTDLAAADESAMEVGVGFHRQMCVYVLHLDKAISDCLVSWDQLSVEEDAPEDIILYSLIGGRGELIMFGGMRSDGRLDSSLSPNAMNMEHHYMSSDTYILRPRYNEML